MLIGIDLDGTIEDSRDDMALAVNRLREKWHLPPLLVEEAQAHVNRGMDQLYKSCFSDYFMQKSVQGVPHEQALHSVRDAYEKEYGDHIADYTRLYSGMEKALKDLAQIGSIAVITNKPQALSQKLLHALSVDKSVSLIVGGDRCPESKPDPSLMSFACRELGLSNPQKSVMIGDSKADIEMGRRFGAATIWCAWGYQEDAPEGCDFVAHKPTDLGPLLQENIF